MTTVYRLTHEYAHSSGIVEKKELGIYSSREKAVKRLDNAQKLEGFRDYPDDFKIKEIVIGEDLWR